ncbi:MAG: GntR family transcriptional regulator [Clostridia bacterium]|nr:GntR family transcriptional regulator [Clostridia bacterium]
MLSIDRQSQTPIYEQIVSQAETLIETGYFASDEPLPSVRTLSKELAINPNTIQKAYSELERRKLCYTVPGSGRFISSEAAQIIRESRRQHLPEFRRLARMMKQAGVSLEELLEIVKTAYEGGNDHD